MENQVIDNGTETLRVRREDCVFEKGQREYLVFPNVMLVPGRIAIEEGDYFEISLDTEGLWPAAELIEAQGLDRYRFLIAAAGLESLRDEYSFSLDPENLMYDSNFLPKVRLRDGKKDAGDFLTEYKALAASLLWPEHSYQDYILGGTDLFSKKPLLLEIAECETTADVCERISASFEEEAEKLRKGSVYVKRSVFTAQRVLMIVFIVLFAILAAGAAWYWYKVLPDKDTRIAVSDAFLEKDYVAVLAAVKDKDLSAFTREERYMAAYAGAALANLNFAQKSEVEENITLITDSLYLDYWIEIGRGDAEQAVDIAKRIGDVELELYALIVEKDSVGNDMNLSGAEKDEKLKSLDEQISALEKTIEEAQTTTVDTKPAETEESDEDAETAETEMTR